MGALACTLLLAACAGGAPRGATTPAVASPATAAVRRAPPRSNPRAGTARARSTAPPLAATVIASPTAATTPGTAGVATATLTTTPAATATPVPTPRATAVPTSPAATPTPQATAAASPGAFASTDNTWTDATNPAAIPVGDGRVSTMPRVGDVDSCTTTFRGGGAQHSGPWIDAASDTWSLAAKIHVAGARFWPSASFHASVQGTTRVITTEDVPVGVPTGTFPIAPTDPAYQYDHNPNSIVPRTATFRLAAEPQAAAPSCTGLGPIGITTDGVLLFNALDAAGRDAGAHEVQDSCQGHPDGQEEYHYHSISSCLASGHPNTSLLVGYAFDGYGIYAEWNASGHLPTNADLDACHGRTSSIVWDGVRTTMYHYDVTLEYPYTVGCFHGTPVRPPPAQRP